MNSSNFDSNTLVPESAFNSQNQEVQTAIKVLRQVADSESNEFEREMLEASADKLEHEVL